MLKSIGLKASALMASAFLLSACMDDIDSAAGQEREQACVVQDETAFARASAEIQTLALRTQFSKTKIQISRCGYMIATRSDGNGWRANLDSLYGKIGSPTWELTVAARSSTSLYSGTTYYNAGMFSFSSRTGKSVSRSELEALNRTLRTLARSSVGRNSASVNIDQELAGAASLNRAGARIRGAIGAAATAVANSAPSTPVASSSNGRKYQCTISCTNSGIASATGLVGDSLRKISVNLTATSSYEAKKVANQNKYSLCKRANLQSFAGASVSCN